MPLSRRTLLAGAIAAVFRPTVLLPVAAPVAATGWLHISDYNPWPAAMWDASDEPVVLTGPLYRGEWGRVEGFRFIESPLAEAPGAGRLTMPAFRRLVRSLRAQAA